MHSIKCVVHSTPWPSNCHTMGVFITPTEIWCVAHTIKWCEKFVVCIAHHLRDTEQKGSRGNYPQLLQSLHRIIIFSSYVQICPGNIYITPGILLHLSLYNLCIMHACH